MNEQLEKGLKDVAYKCWENGWVGYDREKAIAEHFYNLALDDVRELIEKAKQSAANDVSYFALGVNQFIMNEKLKNEVECVFGKQSHSGNIQLPEAFQHEKVLTLTKEGFIEFAQHFYNLVLENVRKKVAERVRQTAYDKAFFGQIPEDKELKIKYEAMNAAFHEKKLYH